MEENNVNVTPEVTNVENSVVLEAPPVDNSDVIFVKKRKKGPIIVVILILLVLAIGGGLGALFLLGEDKNPKKDDKKEEEVVAVDENYLSYKIVGNSIGDFDIRFLQTDNNENNKVYSPLSIKYALAMLSEGANGETKEQIDAILGEYQAKSYINSKNMSFANAMFIRDGYKDEVHGEYINTLKTKFNASIIYDPFEKPDNINNWVKKNTFGLVDGLIEDITDLEFVLANALAIDMEWVNKIKPVERGYNVSFAHREFGVWVDDLVNGGWPTMEFEGTKYKSKSVDFAAVANRYDIVADLGEQNIIDTVTADYNKWLAEDPCGIASSSPSAAEYIPQYMREIKEGYGHISSSTDFSFYVDDNVKVFSKDLKEYDGTTLQYVGIMPIKEELSKYIENLKSSDVDTLINNVKPIELNSFKDGVITQLEGIIPLFKFEYELELIKNLKMLGVQNVFDADKADLSKMVKGPAYIGQAAHKANIEFSNDGIKAGAATVEGGMGAAGCDYDYIYKVPVEKIDITFNKPYMFFVLDKNTKEVWFTGTVYEPKESNPEEDYMDWVE